MSAVPQPGRPAVARDRAELAAARAGLRGRVVLVPTMGALHEGHRSLVGRARELGDSVVVSIFVNPLQFGPGEDFTRYPRTVDADLAACAEEGVDLVLAPRSPEVVYRDGQPQVGVSAGPVGDRFEGASRPGHFDGVLTVVAKLFGLVRPDAAVFGQKDAQQLALVRRMVLDLDLGVDVAAGPTVRAGDGLALSSRNRFLDGRQRDSALALPRALSAGRGAASAGRGAAEVVAAAEAALVAGGDGVRPDYVALVQPDTFEPLADDAGGRALLLLAARVGSTRLIDNAALDLAPAAGTRTEAA